MLTIAQIIISIVLIGLILLQERSSGAGGLFGNGGGGSYQTRRGLEKAIYWATIVSAGIFAILSIVSLTLNK